MSLIEAQLCGKPVVATNAGGVKDTLLNDVTGFLVERCNATAIIEKVRLLIENDELRAEMVEKAAIFAAEKFSKKKEVESYRRLYKTLLIQKGIEYSARQPVAIK